QGAATGVGGILRDVFTMGARPIAVLNALRFGEPEHPRTRHLVAGVVAGIGGYGNSFGVPTVGGEVNFHRRYNSNCLVNAFALGIARADGIFYSKAEGVGLPVVYLGAKTGRDGVGGATMASAEFDHRIEEKRPTVQVGDPFTEKRLLEACLELMATGAVIAIQDMGAAGLTCSAVEMGAKGDLGIMLDLDKVPVREEHMTPYEMMLSESQERMLMVLKPGHEAEAEAIFKKWELDFAVIGEVTNTGHMVLEWNGEVVCDIPLAPLADEAPLYDRPYVSREEYQAWAQVKPLGAVPESADIGADLLKLMACPDLASRRWIWEQYDSQVGADTLQLSGGDAAVVRVHGTRKALAMSTDCTPRYCYADPYEGGKQAVAECYRNLSAVGAKPLAITNCLNFANPQRPEIMAQIVGCLEGMADACRALDFPIVSGNVSLYNESKATGGGSAILPTPAIGGVGLLDDYARMATIGLKAEGEDIVLIFAGKTGHLGQSLWLREILGREDGDPPPVDLEKEAAVGTFIREQIAIGRISAVHDISDGGFLVALAEMALRGGIGAAIDLGDATNLTGWAFGEDQGSYLVTMKDSLSFQRALNARHLIAIHFGETGGSSLKISSMGNLLTEVPLTALRETSDSFFRDWMGG
ncbi:MAG TPA: phosphoribosylformylglycinamidine synthase subunit PurL, partial [Croceibacterium sp.]|nr:phosphoribosylformylglycinamidine synthase subunit PurL [Croceibacterium sp.]